MAILKRVFLLLALFWFGAAILMPAQPTQAADFVVGCGENRVNELIKAISDANESLSSDSITLSAGCTYTLTSAHGAVSGYGNIGLPAIMDRGNLTINGNGAIIERSSAANTPAFRLFFVHPNVYVLINQVTLRNGYAGSVGGGALFNNDGTVVFQNSTLTQNTGERGGALYNQGGLLNISQNTQVINNTALQDGGGFFNTLDGSTNVYESMLQGNTANQDGGGFMIAGNGTASFELSMLSGNQANRFGGGFMIQTGIIALKSSTASGNSAQVGGGFYNENGLIYSINATLSNNSASQASGGFHSRGTTSLQNTIVANSTGGECFIEAGALTGSYSLLETACTFHTGTTNSIVNIVHGDPMLGALTNNGGNTLTHALLAGSPAIDAGANDVLVPGMTYDQRGSGFHRVLGGRVDMGAYEFPCASSPFNVGAGDIAGLRYAIHCSNTDGVNSVINLTNSTYSLTAVDNNDVFHSNGLPVIRDDGTLTLNGNGAVIERANGTPNFRLMQVYFQENLTLQDITLRGGKNQDGGALYVEGGTVNIHNSTFSGNTANALGGGIYNHQGTVNIHRSSLLSNNAGSSGGGIFNNLGTVNVTNTTIASNSAQMHGGGLYNKNAANVLHTTFSGNSAAGGQGGGFYNASGSANFRNTIIANSTGGECFIAGGTLSGSHNLLETACTSTGGTNSLSDTLFADPGLGAITGSPAYFPLSDLSPAIDAGNNTYAAALTTDQPGNARRFNDANMVDTGIGTAPLVDIGAVERASSSSLAQISITDVTLTEGNSGTTAFNFTVSLNVPTVVTVRVNYATGNGSAIAPGDYTAIPLTQLTFNPGEISKQISVLVNGEITHEIHENFTVNLSNPTNATIQDNQGVGLIANDDSRPVIRVNDVSRAEGNSGVQTNLPFTVTLSNPSYQTITVQFTTSDGTATTADSDYTPLSLTTLSFAPGQTSRNVTVKITGDAKHETHEALNFNLSTPTNASIADSLGVGTIANDDSKPSITVNDVSRAEGNSGTTNFPFVVTLSNPSYQTITVNFATSDGTALGGTDYTARSGSLSFAPGVTSRNITVVGNGDTAVEPNETFNFTLSSPVNATIADGLGIGTITNDDAAGLVAPLTLSAFAASLNEGQNTTYTVALTAPPADLLGADSVNVSLSFDATYLSVTPALLSFDASNWNLPQTVTVMAVDDQQAAQQSISLPILHTLSAGDISLNGVPFGVTITDNDALIVPVAPELPQIEAIAPVMPDAPSVELPGVMLVSPMYATSENPVAFTWIGTADTVQYRVLVQQQHDRAAVVDITVSAAGCNGNICVFVSQFSPQAGVSYVWTVTPITVNGAGQPSAEASFSYNPSAPDGIELPGTVIGG